MLFIGLDDTDNLESRGTGHLAREIAAAIAANYPLLGVTRHQLLVDPRVPCTKNNSCAAIVLDVDGDVNPIVLLERVRALILDDAGNVVTESPWSDTGCFTTFTEVVDEVAPTPWWVWVVIAIGAVLAVAVIVLIMRTRRPV